MPDGQGIQLLHDPQGRLAPQVGWFGRSRRVLVCRLLVKGVFDLPTLVVKKDQRFGRVSLTVQQAGQQDMVLAAIDPFGIVMRVADDAHQLTIPIVLAIRRAGVQLAR